MDNQHLAACPFCGLTERDSVAPDAYIPAVSLHNYPRGFRVECEGCGAMGPFHPASQEALRLWNGGRTARRGHATP